MNAPRLKAVLTRLETIEAAQAVREDQDSIHTLVRTYQQWCDGGWAEPSHRDPAALAGLFAPDATYSIPQLTQPARGTAEITQTFELLRETLPHVIHHLTNEDIVVTGDEAAGTFKGIAAIWNSRRQLAFGIYRGTFARLDGEWKFRSWSFELVNPNGGAKEAQPL